ncbi:MAG TPA: hypothetical protein ENN29_09330 [Candidatus Hydrogenedentes bacterium]|nr:hypothetical protein [Candidatus Hydrogenedentota bacterium]
MSFVQAIIVLIVILCVNLLINRIATVALTFTGMSREMARFQSRSAFCTVGFTTSEAESVVNHPVRRRIIMLLMLAGNIGFVSIIVTGVSSFGDDSTIPSFGKILLLVGVLGTLWAIGSSKWIDDKLFKIISWTLKRVSNIEAYDYHALLHLQEGYYVTTIQIDDNDWLVGRTLGQLRLADVGVTILGIKRADGSFLGAPVGGAYIRKGDTLIAYGVRESIERLDRQRADANGWEKHQHIVAAKQEHVQSTDFSETAMSISEITVKDDSWIVGQTLQALRLEGKGVAIFGIEHQNGENVTRPPDTYVIQPGDRLFCYGDHERIHALKHTKDMAAFKDAMGKCAAKQYGQTGATAQQTK